MTVVERHCERGYDGAMLRCLIPLTCWLFALSACGAQTHWVGTWGCAPQLTEPSNLPPTPGLTSNTLRQVVHVSIGGKRLRARFSNAYGTDSLTITSVHAALSTGGSSINPASDRALSFQGMPSVILLPGESLVSDPFDLDLPPSANLAVSICFGTTPTNVTGHPGSRTTSYLQAGNFVGAANLPKATTTPHWYVLTGIDVVAEGFNAAVVVVGDSITDGRGSTTDANNRWPDVLANRLATNAATHGVAVLNEGIGGNKVLWGGLGPCARSRFERDALEQSGVGWLILLEGVNDVGASTNQMVAQDLIAAYLQFIDQAHERNLLVYGVPILPFGGSAYASTEHESVRQKVNRWIRTSGKFDAVIDLEVAVRDPARPANLLTEYDSGDHLHLNPSGYRRMAEAIDLDLFQRVTNSIH
jgi:lysophospholipase L1-like esterase